MTNMARMFENLTCERKIKMDCVKIPQVGKPKPLEPGQDKPKNWTYPQVETDYDGWVDSTKFLPGNYDLVTLKTEIETKRGWYTGQTWDGMRVSPDDRILYWKKVKEAA